MNTQAQVLSQFQKNSLIVALIIGVLLRLLVMIQSPTNPYNLGGGDSRWYIANGIGLVSGSSTGEAYGLPYQLSTLPTAPLYLFFVGAWFKVLPEAAAITAVRLMQIVANLATIYFAYHITRRLSASVRSAWVLAIALLFAPPMITEASEILTETIYIFFIVAGLWAFIVAIDERLSWRYVIISAILFALATLTRAVSLAYPIGLAALMLFAIPQKRWQQRLLPAFIFFLIYALGVGSWTAYNALAYQRIILGSDQLAPSIWRGASPDDGSPEENDALLGEQTAAEQAAVIITSDPMGYAVRRIKDMSQSYLQPHGTINLGNESLRQMASAWVRDGFSWEGFNRLITGEGFWIKLLFYVWHYIGLLAGLCGMWLMRRRWQISLVLIGFIVYTTLVHLLTLDLPRYLFPMYPVYWIFAAIALERLWNMMQGGGLHEPSPE